MPKEELTLTFGSKTGDRFEFTLASIDEYGFVAGAIRLTAGGRSVVLDDRNGIEAMALTHLRRDVQQLLQQDGNLDFGDHDYARMVEVERRGGVVRAHADLPSEDLWLRTEFAWPPPDEATRPDWAINKALRWLGVVRAGFSTDHHYPLERYEEQVAATGLVPEARFATWVREPWEPGRDYAVSVHRRPDR